MISQISLDDKDRTDQLCTLLNNGTHVFTLHIQNFKKFYGSVSR